MAAFQGFTPELIEFFLKLGINNDKAWFDANRPTYDAVVLEPMKALVTEMHTRMLKHRPKVQGEPKVNKSLFRINRDTRFSQDKSPYKTNTAMMLWEGSAPRMQCPAFYFHLEPELVLIGGGIYAFDKPELKRYREALGDPKWAKPLADAAAAVEEAGMPLGQKTYKKVPRGFDAEHPYAELLKHSGLTCGAETSIEPWLYSRELLDRMEQHWVTMLPLHDWLVRFQTEYAAPV